MKRIVGPLIVGVLGVGVLLWLGTWQIQRLTWKQAYLAEIEAQIAADPVALPESANSQDHRFLAVTATGMLGGREIHVLASNRDTGAGYRVIAVLDTGGRRVLVDRGFIPIPAKNDVRAVKMLTVVGNLSWPDEIDSYTPEPDIDANIWFARDVSAMATALDTEPLLIVASSDTGDGTVPFPVSTISIPNKHWEYAITWFLMAAVWFGMTVYLLWRIKRETN